MTLVPTAPVVGDKDVIVGADVETVNVTPLLDVPPIVTITGPVVVPVGTLATMLVADQLVGVAVVPLNFNTLVPCVAPKFAPAIVTVAPTAPLVGDKDVIVGAAVVTVKVVLLLATPPTVTTTDPLVAPVGTLATMLVADQLVGVAVVPLNFTVLVPWVVPKLVPVIVTVVPTAPVIGDKDVIVGVDGTAAAVTNETSVDAGLSKPAVLYACTTK